MRILFCCEFYAPSVGGVQEVIRQIAERLVEKGHHVTVATSKLLERDCFSLNGVRIEEFMVSGNWVKGVSGEVKKYREFVINGDFDLVMIKAAQQWTFDALWPVLDQIKIRKVFVPCGFPGLYESIYEDYYLQMPEILGKFDHLIFYASAYRDIDFSKSHGLNNFSIIPNGASERDFGVVPDVTFRARNCISETAFVFLTVGSFTGMKGHLELVSAFQKMALPKEKSAVLILNGNDVSSFGDTFSLSPKNLIGLVNTYGIYFAAKHMLKKMLLKMGVDLEKPADFKVIASFINQNEHGKKVLVTNFSKPELIQAYMAADLFVFASNVEYSPLVLFESAAAGTPFLSVDVGNSTEIAYWTESGQICPSERDAKGYTQVRFSALAEQMQRMMCAEEELQMLGERGRRNWSERFTWQKIAEQYEKLFTDLLENNEKYRNVNFRANNIGHV